jgi:hypothetical protein
MGGLRGTQHDEEGSSRRTIAEQRATVVESQHTLLNGQKSILESNSRQQSIPLWLCREVMEPAPHSSPIEQTSLYSIVWSAEWMHGLDHLVGKRKAPPNRTREMNRWKDRASYRKQDERRGDAIECSGSTMQELYENVLDVAALSDSMKL